MVLPHVWESFMENLIVAIRLTYGSHPQANDQVEQANQEVISFL